MSDSNGWWGLISLVGLGAGSYFWGKDKGIKQTTDQFEKRKLEDQINYLNKQMEELKMALLKNKK